MQEKGLSATRGDHPASRIGYRFSQQSSTAPGWKSPAGPSELRMKEEEKIGQPSPWPSPGGRGEKTRPHPGPLPQGARGILVPESPVPSPQPPAPSPQSQVPSPRSPVPRPAKGLGIGKPDPLRVSAAPHEKSAFSFLHKAHFAANFPVITNDQRTFALFQAPNPLLKCTRSRNYWASEETPCAP